MNAHAPTQECFKLVLARPVRLPQGRHPALLDLWWSAPQQGDRLVQVYLDGALWDVSDHPQQRRLWLLCDLSRPHRLELLAVGAADTDAVWNEHPELLRGWNPPVAGEASLTVVRDETLPIDTRLRVQLDGMDVDEGPLWPATEHRSGFGALFGLGDFGADAATGPGLGRGELGLGPLGADGSAWRWRRAGLPDGQHSLAIHARDTAGLNAAEPFQADPIATQRLPEPASSFTITTPVFELRWS